MKWRISLILPFLLIATTGVRADEFRLKDGSKIIGTIVGFEGDEFKVQTSYGFAMIRKDSIAEIIPNAAKKTAPPPPNAPEPKPAENSAPQKTPPALPVGEPAPDNSAKAAAVVKPAAATAAPTPTPKPVQQPSAATASAKITDAVKPAASVPATAAPPVTAARNVAKTAAPAVATPTVTAVTPNPTPASAPAIAPIPAPVAPKPQPIEETIRGNLYLNQTFGFQMYRPPGWDLIADAGKALPNAITALGTSDETTLLVVGRDLLTDSLDAHAAATEHKLHDIYQNYRLVSTGHTTISGLPAVETRFRGALGDRDWSVAVATVARGKETFTFLAMTYADSDLIQIQENVISRTLASLQFTSPN